MRIIRDLVRKTGLLLVGLLALAIFQESEPLREGLARKLAPEFAYSSEDAMAKQQRDGCKADARRRGAFVICAIPLSKEAYEYEREHIDSKADFFEEAAAFGMGLLAFGFFVRVLLNIHNILKGRFNVNLMNIPRSALRFIRSRKAELSFMRYKRLFDNGVISEAEFSAKKQELKARILEGR